MVYRFGPYELDQARFELRRAGVVIPVEPRVFDVISYLIRNSDRVVSKAELFEQVWSGRVVVDGALTVAIAAARRALDDDFSRQRVIRTCAGRGYQFVLPCALVQPPRSAGDWQPSPDFVGRNQELQLLRGCFDRLESKRLSAVIVSGEPGIGKSRLLEEFALLARSQGIETHTGRCTESERTPSLWPWSQILTKLASHRADSRLSSLPDRHKRYLSTILPDLIDSHAPVDSTSPEVERFRLFEAIAAALRMLVAPSPTIIAIEDLHRSDDATLRFIQFATQELHDEALIVVATLRPAETQSSPSHAAAIAALTRQQHALHLELKGLSSQATHNLAQQLAAHPLSEAFSATIFRRTSGNPFFIRQLVTLAEDDRSGDTNGPSPVPATISNAILEQISSLPAHTQHLLQIAAVIGRDFSLKVLAATTREDNRTLLEGLDPAARASIVRRSEEGPEHLSFVHILVRDALHARLSLAQRQQLHLQIGLAIDSPTASLSERSSAEVALHLFESGAMHVMPRAAELFEISGNIAARRSAHEDAAHHFARAFEALELADPGNETRRCRLLLLRGESLCKAGDRPTARETLRAAASIARELGASSDFARAALGVAPGFLAAEAGVADPALEQLLLEALDCLDPSDVATRGLVAARLAIAVHWTERESRVSELLSIALEASKAIADPAVTLQIRFAQWFCEWNHKSFDRRRELAEEIQALAEETRDQEMILVGMALRMSGMLERGELAQFDNSLMGLDALAQQVRSPQCLWYPSMYKGMRALIDGRLEEARVCQSEFSRIASKVGDANGFHSLVAQTTLLRLEEGELGPMIPGLELAAVRYPGIRAFRAGLSWAYAQLGRTKEARREIAVLARGDFLDVPQRYDWSAAISFAAEACAMAGDHARSRMLYELLEPLSGRFLLIGLGVGFLGAADRLLGLLASTFGRPDQAQWHLERAISATASAGMKVWNIRAKLDLADLLRRHKRMESRSSFEVLASEAFEEASSADLPCLAKRAESLIKRRP